MEGAAVGSPGGDRPGVRSGGRGAELVPEARDASGGEVWWVTAKRSRVVRRSCITAMPSRCRRRRLVAQHTHSSPSSSYNQVTTITRRSSHAMACRRRLGGRCALLLLGVPRDGSGSSSGRTLAACTTKRTRLLLSAHQRLLWLLYMYLRAVQGVSFL